MFFNKLTISSTKVYRLCRFASVSNASIQSSLNLLSCPSSGEETQANSRVMHRSLSHKPLLAIRAQGINIDTTTQRIIDATCGAAVSCLGHSHPVITQAMIDHIRSENPNYVATIMFTSKPAEELSRFLLNSWDHKLALNKTCSIESEQTDEDSKVYFCSGGSEANDSVMKLCRQYHVERNQPQRVKFLARKQSYHGNTLGALSLSHNLARRAPYEAILGQNVTHVRGPNSYRDMLPDENNAQYVQRLKSEYETIISESEFGGAEYAAFFLEPVTGATSGCLVPPPGYLAMVRELCTKYGILMVCDEVMSGIGRVGSYHAHRHPVFGMLDKPDLQTVAKGLGGGYMPIAAILIGGKVVRALKKGPGGGAWVHGLTYQGHSLACATSLAVQKYIVEHDLINSDGFKLFGNILQSRLAKEDFWFVGDVRGSGLFWAIEFVKDRFTKQAFKRSSGVGMLVHERCLSNGLAVYPSNGTIDGVEGDHVILAPPYNVTKVEMEQIVERLCSTFKNKLRDELMQLD